MEDSKVDDDEGEQGEKGELEEQMEQRGFGEVPGCLLVEVVEELVDGGGAEGGRSRGGRRSRG